MDITRNMNGVRALVVGTGLALGARNGRRPDASYGSRARWNHEGNGQDRDRQR